MDVSKAKAIVEAAIAPMMDALAIPHYRVTVTYGPCDDPNHQASCEARPEYYQASITLDPTRVDSDRDALDALRHELLHVTLADAMLLRRAMCDDDGHLTEHQQAMWEYGIERMVATLEKMLHNLDADDLALVSELRAPEAEGGE